jgi:hypothetical protein
MASPVAALNGHTGLPQYYKKVARRDMVDPLGNIAGTIHMDIKKITGWAGFGLIVFGTLLIIAQVIWPTSIANPPEAGFLGASIKTTFFGLAVFFVGAVLLATAAFGRRN